MIVAERLIGDGVMHTQTTPAEQLLQSALEAVRDRRAKYGPPTSHFTITVNLVNAAFGTTFTPADWAVIMVLDKIARHMGPNKTDDTPIDVAGYAACLAEVESDA